jgi:hypothetical protein
LRASGVTVTLCKVTANPCGIRPVPLLLVWCLCSLGPLPPMRPLVHIPSHKPVLVFAKMFLTLTFLAESIDSAAKFFRRRFDHGELAMAAVLNRKNTGYSRRRMPKTRTGKAIRFFECFSLFIADTSHRATVPLRTALSRVMV